MRRLEIVVLPEVEEQIGRQVRHIAEDSVSNALAWEDRLTAAIERLADIHGYAIDEDISHRVGQAIHKFAFEGTYLIHFRIIEAAGIVEVVNFRHGARLPRLGEP